LGLNITPIGATIVPETVTPLTIEGSIAEKIPPVVGEEKIEKDALELQAVAAVETPDIETKKETV
jgi:hypothetical protein